MSVLQSLLSCCLTSFIPQTGKETKSVCLIGIIFSFFISLSLSLFTLFQSLSSQFSQSLSLIFSLSLKSDLKKCVSFRTSSERHAPAVERIGIDLTKEKKNKHFLLCTSVGKHAKQGLMNSMPFFWFRIYNFFFSDILYDLISLFNLTKQK